MRILPPLFVVLAVWAIGRAEEQPGGCRKAAVMTSFTPPPRPLVPPPPVEQVETGAAASHPARWRETHQSPTAFNQNAKPSVALEAGTAYYGDGGAVFPPPRPPKKSKTTFANAAVKMTLQLCIK